MKIVRNFNAFGRYEVVPFHGECYLHSTLPIFIVWHHSRSHRLIEMQNRCIWIGERNNILKGILHALVLESTYNTRIF